MAPRRPRRPASLARIRAAARDRLGFQALSEAQELAVRAVLSGRDTLAVMPTGSGKSAVYQLAGALMPGATVVVSPLIALQHDQLMSLQELSAGAALALNSSLSAAERREALTRLERGDLEFLLLAPEQFAPEGVLEALSAARPSLFVVDEAHGISDWGHDFRPAYLGLGAVIEALGRPQVLALTATAAPPVRDEIVQRLRMQDPMVIVRGFDRPNIDLIVRRFSDDAAKFRALGHAVMDQAGAGIVYVATRRGADELAAAWSEAGRRAAPYHAGMPAVERERVHLAFRDDELDVVVATIAFGMGVDKPNVRYVFHADISESPDAYWQEIGRGGRDGKPASAVLFYRPEDLGLRDYFGARSTLRAEDIAVAAQAIAAAGGTPVHVAHVADRLGMSHDRTQRVVARLADAGSVEVDARGMIRARPGMEPMAAVADAVAAEERRQRVEGSRLRMMRAYADTGECRRAFLLSYFGEPVTRDCGHCDRCRERAEQRAAGRRPRRRASTAGERSFPVGSAVDHAQWGRGTVQRHESGRVTVLFDEVGYKTLDLAAVMERSLLVPAAEEQGAAA